MASNYPALELCKISTLSLFFFCFFFNIWPFPPQIKGAYSAGTSIKTKKDADPLITMFSFMAAINQFPDRLTSILKERQGWGGLETVSILIIAFIVAYSQAKLFPDVSCSGVVSHARTRAISTNASADSSVNIFIAKQKSLENNLKSSWEEEEESEFVGHCWRWKTLIEISLVAAPSNRLMWAVRACASLPISTCVRYGRSWPPWNREMGGGS